SNSGPQLYRSHEAKRSCGKARGSSFPSQGKNRRRHRADVAVASLASTRTILRRKWRMASLEKRYDGRYRIIFCWQGERRYYSLGKMPEREARSCLDRLEESLRFVDRGLLEVPPDADLGRFLVSGGKLNGKLVEN